MKTYLKSAKKRKKITVGLVVIAILTVCAVLLLAKISYKQVNLDNVSFKIHSDLSAHEISDTDKKVGFIYKATNKSNDVLVTFKQENGLAAVGSVTKQSVTEILADGVNRRYPMQYPEFEILSEKSPVIDDEVAYSVQFTYKNNDQKIWQNLVGLKINDDQAIVLSMQSSFANYETNKDKYFDPLIQSITVK